MNDTNAQDEPQYVFDDSRRLTGPNRYFGSTAVVLTPLGAFAADAQAHTHWAARVQAACAKLGWPDPRPIAHRHAQGAFLAFAAPATALFTATEINEWAWETTAAELQHLPAAGFTLLHAAWSDAGAAQREQAEASRPLARLHVAASARGLPTFEDDDALSIGAGSGGLSWPRAALPLAMDVPWPRLHDVPTVLVTGSNGKTTTARLIAAIAAAAGHTAGVCSTEGVRIGSETITSGDYAGPAGARVVLRHPSVQFAVLETARGGLLRRGLAVRRADAAVVTNVSADHFGEYGIGSLDDIAEIKLVVAHAVGHQGSLVLNGADEVLMRVARHLPHAASAHQALFALDFDHPELKARRAAGGATCGMRGAHLILEVSGTMHDLGSVAEMPISVRGAARHNIENLAAAALAAAAAGAPVEAIRQTFARFGANPQDNPGRLEHYRHRGAHVLIDYAHNPDGLAQLLRVARALEPRRLGLLLGQAGNRDDAAITALARTAAAAAADRIVIKELPLMLRGRPLGEVPALLLKALQAAGTAPERIAHEPDEETAALALLDWAEAGDVVVLPLHTTAVRQRVAQRLG